MAREWHQGWDKMDPREREMIEDMADEAIRTGDAVIRVVGRVKVVVFTQKWYDAHQEAGDEPLSPVLTSAQGTKIYVYKIPGDYGFGIKGGKV